MAFSDEDNSFSDCGGPFDLTPKHTISSWETMPTTLAEVAVIAYLRENRNRYAGATLLHVGIGNSALFDALADNLSKYIGITISLPEVERFNRKVGGSNIDRVILGNKYDCRVYSQISELLDIIVDVNLKSFACCEKHFQHLITFYADRLRIGGAILTTDSGVRFGWAGNTNVAYTPGANLNPAAAQRRILGSEGLQQIARIEIRDVKHWHGSCSVDEPAHTSNETLWILTKV